MKFFGERRRHHCFDHDGQKTGTAVTQLEQAAAALDESGQALGEAIQGTRPMGRQ
ncbi:hypothetical protein AB0878_28630 [Amycolatopsis sp. NPDC047767]|uniref:hypothetical protein n=1 Tax=Amycolatopsis sp. NPDC047767 TaxID=3156765 RepID=UPI0034560D93